MSCCTNKKLKAAGVAVPEILLPQGVDLSRWAVIACDQFTSQRNYWDAADEIAGDSPSALRIALPEIYLEESEKRVPQINAKMTSYLSEDVLSKQVNGFVLVRRQISAGTRYGLLVLLDLDEYDFSADSKSRIRATEGTIISRLPPRVQIRENAPLELPHILVLIDDPEKTVIEPLLEKTKAYDMEKLYDFDLMLDGGHIEGFGIAGGSDIAAQIAEAISVLDDSDTQAKKYGFTQDEAAAHGLMTFAMGDGNHSLATAKTIWERTKAGLSELERENHPARFALVELNNLHEDSLKFEPIHRLMMNCDPAALLDGLTKWAAAQHGDGGQQSLRYVLAGQSGEIVVENAPHSLPVGTLQLFLDEYIAGNAGVEIDYIHDDDALISLAEKDNCLGFLCDAIEKSQLFRSILLSGPLPRKTFSIGNARDKRYYLEARKIK